MRGRELRGSRSALALASALALCSSSRPSRCRQDMHNQPKSSALRDERVLRGRLERAAAGRGHGRARHAAGRRGVLHRQERQGDGRRAAVPADAAGARSRRAALQHLLHAVPRPDRQRQRHDRAARLPAAAVVPHRPAAPGADRALLRRDDQRLRRDAGLPGADRAARSLGDRRLRPRAATEPARGGSRRARRRIGRSSRSRPARRRSRRRSKH